MYIVGRYPKLMNIGIVNDESDCLLQFSSNGKCLEQNLSCFLMQELRDPLKLIRYNSSSEALQNARHDHLYLIYHFKKNFTSNIIDIFDSEYRGLSDLKIHLTSDNPMFIHHICSKFEDAFYSLLSAVAKSCNIREQLSKIQIIESIYAQKGNFLNDIIPALVMM
jgi:hypothetical protein